MPFKKRIDVYSENRKNPINTKYVKIVKTAGTYNYHYALKG
jgi:hypothetical protein